MRNARRKLAVALTSSTLMAGASAVVPWQTLGQTICPTPSCNGVIFGKCDINNPFTACPTIACTATSDLCPGSETIHAQSYNQPDPTLHPIGCTSSQGSTECKVYGFGCMCRHYYTTSSCDTTTCGTLLTVICIPGGDFCNEPPPPPPSPAR